jgi:hypothetical protein
MCGFFLKCDQGQLRLDDTVHFGVSRWLIVTDTLKEQIQVVRIMKAKLVAENERALLSLIERDEGGCLDLHSE